MDFIIQLQHSAVMDWVRESGSLLGYPAILFLHTIGLATVAGLNGAIDLRLLGVALTSALTLLGLAGSASGAITCSLSAGTLTVTTDEQLAIVRSGDGIVVTGASCAASPTVLNTTAIVVTGSLDGPEHVDVNQSGGAFGDIDFDLTSLVFANGAALIVTGTAAADTITLAMRPLPE